MEVTFNMTNGNVFIEGVKISLGDDGEIIPKLRGFSKNLVNCNALGNEYLSAKKFSTLGSSALLVIHTKNRNVVSICILFDEIVFFDRTILESKIIKRFERKYGMAVGGSSSTVGEIGNFTWGKHIFLTIRAKAI